MKTKLKLVKMGCKHRPVWHIVVQGDKKKLTGKYIERVGFWRPRVTKTVPRGILLNRHKIRYWMSVGAQPTDAVVRVLNRFGNDFWPKLPMPFGSASLYEKPKREYGIAGHKDTGFTKLHHSKYRYRQMLQEQFNIVERKRRVQAEAMANLGEGQYQQDIELIQTDDFDSEEGDIFERVKQFEELQRRLDTHRKDNRKLRGNDLRYNVYLKKMNKLTRKDLGLDVEAYKDYVNNLKIFAKYKKDYEVLADDQYNSLKGVQHSILGSQEQRDA